MLDIYIFKLHAEVGGVTISPWWFLFLDFCILLDSLPVCFVCLFLLLVLHLDSINLWPSFLLSFFFPNLKNLVPFSCLRHLIQSLPSVSQLQPQLLLKQIPCTHFKFLISFCFYHTALAHLLSCHMGLSRVFWRVLVILFWWKINSWWDMLGGVHCKECQRRWDSFHG